MENMTATDKANISAQAQMLNRKRIAVMLEEIVETKKLREITPNRFIVAQKLARRIE